ncbi:MAG TPA: glutamyl-tRNA reductase [Pseudomonadales bacterium]|nr:glutamyl-tRNA reductase [Pseudomonadales bacterium]
MGLLALGINHKTASVDLRERVAFGPERIADALHNVCASDSAREVAILSTCNRMEMYCWVESQDSRRILEWLGQYHHIGVQNLSHSAYEYWDEQAVKHMSRVAVGLDSLVLGEPQILGQIKTAWAVAKDARTVGPHLSRWFQHVFSVAKQVRTDTAIGSNPVSVAFAAVSLAKRIFTDLDHATALLIGAGETIELVAKHLAESGVKSIIVANRTLERAQRLAEPFGGLAIGLSEIPDVLQQADIVISSTASPLPILGKGAVEHALKKRRHKPIFMVDIAVPRDIEPEVGELADVYLYTVDDLQEVIQENIKSREMAALEAERIIDERTAQFMLQLRELNAVDTVRTFRAKSEMIRDEELQRALASIKTGAPVEEIMARLARTLTNKLLHEPSIQLKKAGAEGRSDLLNWAHDLFGLHEYKKPMDHDSE